MSTPLILTDSDAVRLREIAATWAGTPWVADGAVKGSGASCTNLPYAILVEVGHKAPKPPSRLTMLKREIVAKCIEWLDGHPEHYQRLAGIEEVRAGDVILFDIGIGHMAICTGGTEIMHSWQRGGAHFSNFSQLELATRFRGAWRPVIT